MVSWCGTGFRLVQGMAYSANYAAGSWTAVSLSPGDGSGVGAFNHRQFG